MKAFTIQSFLGAFTATDPSEITSFSGSSALLNVRIEDKSIAPRLGYRKLIAAQSNFGTAYGLEYISGYKSDLTSTDEFVSFESISGTVHPFSRNVTTGAVTAIRTAVPAVPSLNASIWVGKPYGSYAYFVNPNETISICKYTQGTADSWSPLGIPVSPTSPLTYSVTYGGGSLAAYSTRSWATVVTGNVTYTGVGTATGFSANADGSLTLGTSTSGAGSATIDMHDGATGINANQDWTSNDIFYFTVQGASGPTGSGSYRFDKSQFGVQLINDDGSPVTFNTLQVDSVQLTSQSGTTAPVYGVRVEFDKSDRTLWDNIRKVVFSYSVTNNSGAVFTMSKWYRGGVWISSSRNLALPRDMLFNYSYYYSANLWESGLCSTPLQVTFAVLQGYQPMAGIIGLGVQLTLTATTSGDSNVDDNRFYGYDGNDNVYRLFATQADGTPTYVYKINYNELHAFTQYSNITPFKTDKCVNLCVFKSWIVWFYQGPASSIRHSRTDNVERQASDLDNPLEDTDPPLRGATFSMPGFTDEPLGGVAVGDTLIIAGSIGCYGQVGSAPALMSPPKRVSGSFGVASKRAFTAWKDDSGNEGMAYLTPGGQVRFVAISPGFTGDVGGSDTLISSSIQTGAMSPGTFLRDGQSLTDFSSAHLFVDQYNDSLWVVMGANALVLRRPHPETGTPRQWEAYTYPVNLAFNAASTKRWLKVMTSTGIFAEIERNYSTGADITGTLRDDGVAISSLYWQSGNYGTPNSRVKRIRVDRDAWTDKPTVTVQSDRQTTSQTFVEGDAWVYFNPLQQGNNHVIKIAISESTSPIRMIEVHLFAASGRFRANYA